MTYRKQQRPRNAAAERQGRRVRRQQKLASAIKLPPETVSRLRVLGLSRPVDSVRGMLLTAILSEATQSADGGWGFDGSIRDLADGGLADGKRHSRDYLLKCMQDFVRQGILEATDARRGRPTLYAVRRDAAS